MAMVGTYHLESSVCCGLGGSSTDIFITESNQVLTQRINGGTRFCCLPCGTIEGTGSRGLNDPTMVFTTNSINRGRLTPATNTQTITSATRDTIEMKCDHWIKKTAGNLNERKHGTMSWDLAAKIMKFRSSGPCARVLTYHKTA